MCGAFLYMDGLVAVYILLEGQALFRVEPKLKRALNRKILNLSD